MIRRFSATALLAILALGLSIIGTTAQQTATRYDYHASNEDLIDAGMQALFICNGLFVSNRTMDQLYAAELKYERIPLASPDEIKIDYERKTVAIGPIARSRAPVMRAAHRVGLGCVLLGPEQTFAEIERLPALQMPAPSGEGPGSVEPQSQPIKCG